MYYEYKMTATLHVVPNLIFVLATHNSRANILNRDNINNNNTLHP